MWSMFPSAKGRNAGVLTHLWHFDAKAEVRVSTEREHLELLNRASGLNVGLYANNLNVFEALAPVKVCDEALACLGRFSTDNEGNRKLVGRIRFGILGRRQSSMTSLIREIRASW